MASITKHANGWRAFVERHGIRKTKLLPTKREAQAWALETENRLNRLKSSGGKTLSDAVDHYLKTVSVTKSKPEWERRRFEQFMDFIGDVYLADISSEDIGRWRDDRLRTVTGATVQREANLLRNLFTIAVDEWKWLSVHPFRGVRLPEQEEARHQLWRWQKIKRVLRSGREGKTGEVVKAFHIALHTGMRLAEILTGTYDDRRFVYRLERSKTSKKPVEVPIPRRARKLLPERFTVGPNEASTLFSKLVKQLMLGDLHFHDARATALTLLARRVDVLTLARISRHKDLSLLMRVYYRATPEDIAKRI
jgi:integrase